MGDCRGRTKEEKINGTDMFPIRPAESWKLKTHLGIEAREVLWMAYVTRIDELHRGRMHPSQHQRMWFEGYTSTEVEEARARGSVQREAHRNIKGVATVCPH